MLANVFRNFINYLVYILGCGSVQPTKMTKDEKLHLDRVQQLGCIACYFDHGTYSPAEIHHIIDGNKRKGHFYVLPLCVSHHRGGGDGVGDKCVSRHPFKARFEDRYGQESDILAYVDDKLRERYADD